MIRWFMLASLLLCFSCQTSNYTFYVSKADWKIARKKPFKKYVPIDCKGFAINKKNSLFFYDHHLGQTYCGINGENRYSGTFNNNNDSILFTNKHYYTKTLTLRFPDGSESSPMVFKHPFDSLEIGNWKTKNCLVFRNQEYVLSPKAKRWYYKINRPKKIRKKDLI